MTSEPERRTPLRTFFLYGLLGGTIANIGSYVGATLLGLPYPPEAVFQLLIAPVPGSIQSIVVETFREYAKYGTFAVTAIAYTFLYGIIAVLAGALSNTNVLTGGKRFLLFATAIPTLIGLGFQALLAQRFSMLSSLAGWLIAAILMVTVNFAYAAILNDTTHRRSTLFLASSPKGGIRRQDLPTARRGFLKKAAITVAVLAVGGIVARFGTSLFSGQPVVRSNTPIPINGQNPLISPSDLPQIFRDPRISDLVGSEVTDNRAFYRVDINPISPDLNFDQWSLMIKGKVKNPIVIDREALLAMPATDQFATLECVSNTINPPGALISNAKWTGASLASLLKEAEVTADARSVVFRCADGYTVGIPLERAMLAGSLLAYKMNDEYLPREHGSPLRAIVPGIYGMMNAKWITEIELTDSVYLGYWQERGWSNDAKIKTTSIIYYPVADAEITGTVPIAGVAFAGDRGIRKVEVSTDGGNTWHEAKIKNPKSDYSWVLWAYEWTPDSAGAREIQVRTTDGLGQLQDPAPVPSFPDGASGYHSVRVRVT